jgi:hypothetical protein
LGAKTTGHGSGVLFILGLHTASTLLARPVYTCPRCGNHAAHEVTKDVRKLSLFFLPVCRVGAEKYFDTCTICGLTISLTKEQAESARSQPVSSGPQDSPTWPPQDR